MRRCSWLIFVYLLAMQQLRAQSPRTIPDYGPSYRDAAAWLQKNTWINDSLSCYGIPPREALAIVFPELMRYSSLRDRMEVAGLMVLYTRLGKGYADFSVGHFQMKPSFVAHLEQDARRYLTAGEIQRICPFLLPGTDTPEIRRKRVNSLTSAQNEVCYLALFYKVCLRRFQNRRFASATARIRFLATSYNCGYRHTAGYILKKAQKRLFPVFLPFNTLYVNYASLSLKWWSETRISSYNFRSIGD